MKSICLMFYLMIISLTGMLSKAQIHPENTSYKTNDTKQVIETLKTAAQCIGTGIITLSSLVFSFDTVRKFYLRARHIEDISDVEFDDSSELFLIVKQPFVVGALLYTAYISGKASFKHFKTLICKK